MIFISNKITADWSTGSLILTELWDASHASGQQSLLQRPHLHLNTRFLSALQAWTMTLGIRAEVGWQGELTYTQKP